MEKQKVIGKKKGKYYLSIILDLVVKNTYRDNRMQTTTRFKQKLGGNCLERRKNGNWGRKLPIGSQYVCVLSHSVVSNPL